MNAVRHIAAGCAAVVASFSMILTSTALAGETPTGADDALIARGRYLVTTSGCNDCHTPLRMGENGPEPDMSRMLSGHPESLQIEAPPAPPGKPWSVVAAETMTAWSGPWGVSFTANLTPDVETGLGRWTLQNFKDTIRTGRHMGRGRQILPPMPIPMYKHFNDADFEAIFAFLRSIPPVKNRVPEPLSPATQEK
jgi:mono/diheme cytochrome c family protein